MNSAQSYKGFITFLILAGIISTAAFGFDYIRKATNVQSDANINEKPLNIQISNITEISAEITWITSQNSIGEIIVGINPNDQCFIFFTNEDDCKSYSTNVSNKTHRTTIENLTPNTTYYLKIKNNEFIDQEILTFTTNPQSIDTNIKIEKNDEAMDIQQKNKNQSDDTSDDDPSSYGIVPAILGINTFERPRNINQVDALIFSEFREAIIFNDQRYDFNGDEIVDMADYPLFINFIIGKEVEITQFDDDNSEILEE